MNKLFKLGVMITLSISTLAGCGNNVGTAPIGSLGNGAFAVRADGTNANAQLGAKDPKGNHPKGGPGMKGGFGLGGFPVELNLTADQKTQLEALRKADKPTQQPDKTAMDANRTAMEAVRKEINDAFISETFDATALKAKLDALKPVKPNNDNFITAEANRIVKTYNILTAEQRALLETKQQEMANKAPKTMPLPPANFDPAKMVNTMFDKLATDLGLNDTQKASLKTILQPPTNAAKPDFQAEQAKRKANQDAINAALKAGNATVESIAAILKANAPTEMKPQEGNELDQLAKIHAILNADQRKKFIESKTNKGPGFGTGGKEGPGGKGAPGGFGGKEGPGGKGHGEPGRK